jgi:CubicO group peptidase (beta-lactamase class C family)
MFERTCRRLQQDLDEGHAKGVQACIYRRGEPALEVAIGEARPGVAMTGETAVLWMSACKPITAVALATWVEAGRLAWDDPVAEWWPSFAQRGKQDITVRQVLTHTGGFRAAPVRYPVDDWETIRTKVAAARLEPKWVPGERAGYHVHTGWWALGAVLEEVSGLDFLDAVRRSVLEPLEMRRSWVTMPGDVWEDLTRERALADMPDTSEPTDSWISTHASDKTWCTNVRPGGNGYGPASELCRFYRMLLDERLRGGDAPGSLDGVRLLREDTVAELRYRHRDGMMDRTFRHVMDWGLGFMLDSKPQAAPDSPVPYGYGPHASRETFGHGGSQCAVGFADPRRTLAGAVLWNGQPGEPVHQRRLHETMSALYEELD